MECESCVCVRWWHWTCGAWSRRRALAAGTLGFFCCLIDVNAANYSLTASRRQKRATPLRFLSAWVLRDNCTRIHLQADESLYIFSTKTQRAVIKEIIKSERCLKWTWINKLSNYAAIFLEIRMLYRFLLMYEVWSIASVLSRLLRKCFVKLKASHVRGRGRH